jgi:hypothetical protein
MHRAGVRREAAETTVISPPESSEASRGTVDSTKMMQKLHRRLINPFDLARPCHRGKARPGQTRAASRPSHSPNATHSPSASPPLSQPSLHGNIASPQSDFLTSHLLNPPETRSHGRQTARPPPRVSRCQGRLPRRTRSRHTGRWDTIRCTPRRTISCSFVP